MVLRLVDDCKLCVYHSRSTYNGPARHELRAASDPGTQGPCDNWTCSTYWCPCQCCLTNWYIAGVKSFGSTYAQNATWCLRILALAAFPLIIKNHYVSICRIQDHIGGAVLGILPGGILEVVAASLGAHFGGLSGLSAGWVLAITVEAVGMSRTVYKAISSDEPLALQDAQNSQEIQAIWLIETSSIPAIAQSYPGIKALQQIENSMPGIKAQRKTTKQLNLKPPRLQKLEHDEDTLVLFDAVRKPSERV